MQPKVAVSVPGKPAMRIPTNVAALIAIGPGVISAIVTRFANSCIVSQPFASTTPLSISGMAAYPPPTLNSPIWKKTRNSTIMRIRPPFAPAAPG
mgnify:CR=1 FL=1